MFADIDGDLDLDLMVIDGLGDPNDVYRQTAPRVFAEVGASLGLNDTGWGKSATFIDYDNDGDQDVFVTRMGDRNLLYRHDGAVFVNVSAGSGLNVSAQNTGAAWADYDRDGFLDVFVTTYSSSTDYLFRNLGNGTFQDVTAAAGVGNPNGYGFQPTWVDYDNDNDPDLYLSNDIFGSANVLYRNLGNGTFQDVSFGSGAGVDMSAMGVAISDFDGNGFFDIFVSNTAAGNVLLRNNGDLTFTNVAATVGVLGNVVCWGSEFFDYDNDGRSDLYVAVSTDQYVAPSGGHSRNAPPSTARLDYPDLLYRNLGGSFQNVSNGSGADNRGKTFCSTTGDYDADGDLDLYLTNWWEGFGDSSCVLLENQHVPRGQSLSDWLRIRLIGTTSNRDGVGARVWLQTNLGWQMREKQIGSSYLGSDDPFLHFGTGTTTNISRLYVRWPSGLIERYNNVATGQLVTLTEGDGTLATGVGLPGAIANWDPIRVVPNPIRSTAELSLTLVGARERLRILDVQGRSVRTFSLEGKPGSAITLAWDRTDQDGRLLPAGTYFMEVEDGMRAANRARVVVIR